MSQFPVYITYSNIGYKDFAMNLCINFNTRMPNCFLYFYCLDESIYSLLNSKEYKNVILIQYFKYNVESNFLHYGSYQYNNLTHIKVHILLESVDKYEFIHFIDCDVAFFKEPIKEFYEEFNDCDIVFQVDSGPQDGDYYVWVCTGNMTLRKSTATTDFILRILQAQKEMPNKNDQECLFEMLKHDNIKDIRTIPNVKCNIYSRKKLVNGDYYKREGLSELAINLHANYVIGSRDKIAMLSSAGLWNLDIFR